MTGRERVMTALRNKQPDRVPATPDISSMIPARLTGRPFWELWGRGKPSLPTAYINAVKHFGIDGWMFNGTLTYKTATKLETSTRIVKKEPENWEVHSILHTPDGDMSQVTICPRDMPAITVEKYVKDIKADFKKIRHYFSDVIGYDDTEYRLQKEAMGESGMICCCILPPGFQIWSVLFNGGLEALSYAYYDFPDLFEELTEIHDRQTMQKLEMALDAGVESILTGGSGSITLQSPALFRELSLPTIKKITKMCRQAGVICGIHSCGKERYVVEACAEETELDYLNPLERPPMGDCDLAECKEKFGNKLALMGNLHTTDVMLFGTVDDVRLESLRAIRSAGASGGFVLSTGDECGRDTPFENILETLRTAKEFGTYPLDFQKIEEEISRLEKKKKRNTEE
jgi:uroporphyrinogen decarboxylase